jgi:hypothetical protein
MERDASVALKGMVTLSAIRKKIQGFEVFGGPVVVLVVWAVLGQVCEVFEEAKAFSGDHILAVTSQTRRSLSVV